MQLRKFTFSRNKQTILVKQTMHMFDCLFSCSYYFNSKNEMHAWPYGPLYVTKWIIVSCNIITLQSNVHVILEVFFFSKGINLNLSTLLVAHFSGIINYLFQHIQHQSSLISY